MDIAMKAMMAELAPVIRDFVTDAQAPLIERIAALEADKADLIARCESAEAAVSETATAIVADFRVESAEEFRNLFSADGEQRGIEMQSLLESELAPLHAKIAELEARPVAEPIDVPLLVQDEVAKLPPPEKGKDANPEQVASLVAEHVERAVAALPRPQDGKNAAGIVEALKDSGELVLTLEDGRLIRTGIRDGERGKDGFGFDDMDACVLDDDRTIELSFRRGEEEKAFTFKWPTMIYRQVYKDGEQYQPGDCVTWGGSLWHCDKATSAKPGTEDWTLAAKKGRDGKDFTARAG